MTTEHLPIPDQESQPFWDALGEGRFLLKFCRDCGKAHYYPRTYCPYCWGETDWREASGNGTVFATTVMRRIGLPPFNKRVPYNVAIVELDEGPRLMTSVVDTEPERVQIGMRVRLHPTQDGPAWLPTFRLAESDGER